MVGCRGSCRCCWQLPLLSFWLAALGRLSGARWPPAPADMIVVLAGDFSGNRILTAARSGSSRICSPSAGQRSIGRVWIARKRSGDSVRRSARLSRVLFVRLTQRRPVHARRKPPTCSRALSKRHARRIDIVTSDYHTRRAGNIYRAQAPGLEIHMVAAPDVYFTPDGWWKSREGRKTFLLEWMKTVANWFGM